MKKLFVIAALLVCASVAFAGMDSVKYTVVVTGITTKATNSASYVVRGVVESVYIDSDFGQTTGTVTIADDYGTVFTKSCTADAQYFPRAAAHTTAGAALTWTELASTAAGPVTNTVTTTQFHEKIAVAGPLKCTVAQTAAGASTGTNTYYVTVLYNR